MLRRTVFGGLLATAVAGRAIAAPKPWRAPRTRYGAPELEGTWTNGTYTELERPKAFNTPVIGEAEAKAWEAKLAPTGGVNVGKDELCQGTSEFPESGSGMMRIRGQIRTSRIIEPEDGQIPYSEAGKKAAGFGKYDRSAYDHPEQRPQPERCLTSEGAGAPIFTAPDTNLLQIVQTPDLIVMVAEKYHDIRIVRLGAGPPSPTLPRSWLGESWGAWEGETLVVRTARSQGPWPRRSSRLPSEAWATSDHAREGRRTGSQTDRRRPRPSRGLACGGARLSRRTAKGALRREGPTATDLQPLPYPGAAVGDGAGP